MPIKLVKQKSIYFIVFKIRHLVFYLYCLDNWQREATAISSRLITMELKHIQANFFSNLFYFAFRLIHKNSNYSDSIWQCLHYLLGFLRRYKARTLFIKIKSKKIS